MPNRRFVSYLLVAFVGSALACTNSASNQTAGTATPVSPTRSVPVQPPVDPFDLIATIFPATPAPTGIGPAPTPTATSTTANVVPATPTPLSAGEDQILFDTRLNFGNLPTFDGESMWFTDGPFAVRTALSGEVTGRFQVARANPPQLVFADGHIWALDTSEGELRKLTLEGETVNRIPAQLASRIDASVDSIFVYANTSERVTRYNLSGQKISSFEVDAGGVFKVTDDAVWFWRDDKLTGYTHDGEQLAEWAAPSSRPVNPSTSLDLQLSNGFAWLSGYSQTEIARIDLLSGTVFRLQLELADGEFTNDRGGQVSMLVLDSSVWVGYPRWSIPLTRPGEFSSVLRRLEVFDFNGNVLGKMEFDDCCSVTLAKLSVLNEVWMTLNSGPALALTLFQRFDVNDFVPLSSRFTPEQLEDPLFPDWLDPDIADQRPPDEEIIGGWKKFLSNTELDVDGMVSYHFCEDGPLVIDAPSPFISESWEVRREPALSLPQSDWGWVDVWIPGDTAFQNIVLFDLRRTDGSILFRSRVDMTVRRSSICLGLDD